MTRILGYYTCTFDVVHYANNGTWTCNVTADRHITLQYQEANTTIDKRIIRTKRNRLIDYGDLTVQRQAKTNSDSNKLRKHQYKCERIQGYGGTDPVIGED
jgi:hypothetical protein